MKKIMSLIIFSILTSCANSSWEHRSGNNSDLNFHSAASDKTFGRPPGNEVEYFKQKVEKETKNTIIAL